MYSMGKDLAKDDTKLNNRPGFKNQGVIKAAARGQILEALTAFKGSSLGKKGLLLKALESLDKDFESGDYTRIANARDCVIKLASLTAKDDKGVDLSEMLRGQGANIQINFNNYFKERDKALPINNL